jgi:inhibitor of KinA
MSEADVIRAHAGGTYRVFMLGFVPGFAYLGIVDERIAVPRHTTPRVRVPAGSVGIAGVQTGIYPSETPGGWQLIGRTPLKPFDPSRDQPFLMKAGDAVQFYPIDLAEYERMTPGPKGPGLQRSGA